MLMINAIMIGKIRSCLWTNVVYAMLICVNIPTVILTDDETVRCMLN